MGLRANEKKENRNQQDLIPPCSIPTGGTFISRRSISCLLLSGYNPNILYSSRLHLFYRERFGNWNLLWCQKVADNIKRTPLSWCLTQLNLQQQEYHKNYKNCKLTTDFKFTDINNGKDLDNFKTSLPLFNLSKSIKSLSATNLSSKVHYHSHT